MALLQQPTSILRVALCAALCLVLVDDVSAQWRTKWLAIGDLHKPYASGGAEQESAYADSEMMYPGIFPRNSFNHWKGLWISARNVTDETGKSWDIRTSHIGPRGLGLGEMFDQTHDLHGRFEKPMVTVDGLETFQRPTRIDQVDPELDVDRMIRSVFNSSLGITTERRALQFGNEYLDHFHIVEYIFTNTGNVDDDSAIELPDQTLNDVYFAMFERPKVYGPASSWNNSDGGAAWGKMQMNDAVGDGLNDYGTDFRAQFSWQGSTPGKDYSTLGNPMMFGQEGWVYSVSGDTLGRLAGASFVGQVTLHADGAAHAAVNYTGYTDNGSGADNGGIADDPAQPSTMTYIESDWSDITTGNDHNNVSKMQLERAIIECGAEGNPISPDSPLYNPAADCEKRTWPTQAYMVMGGNDATAKNSVSLDQFARQTANPSLGKEGGWGNMNAYGPYDIGPGEQVRIVVADVVAGLSTDAQEALGVAYKRASTDDDAILSFDANGNGTIEADEQMTKNDWVMTGRDSLFKSFEMVQKLFDANYQTVHPPRPPMTFAVVADTNQISLTWEAYPQENADGTPRVGWEIYRAQKDYSGLVTALEVPEGANKAIPDESRRYQKIATLPANATSFDDNAANTPESAGGPPAPGEDYFYYIQAVGEPVAAGDDPAGVIPTGVQLRSSRYYANTFSPARLKRPPGNALSDVRIVPNPFNLNSTESVRFGRRDQLAFFNIPGNSTIKIYSEIGELIDTIENNDGSGDAYWYQTTSSRQLIVSGVYIAVITDNETGEQVIRKFIVIR